METESTRQLKVSKEIQRHLAEIIRLKGMAIFGGAMLTVSGVRISPDLSMAKIYLSIFPSNKATEVMATIEKMNKGLRGELGKKMGKQLRIIPELTFFIDDSLDYVEKIDGLLNQ